MVLLLFQIFSAKLYTDCPDKARVVPDIQLTPA